MAVMGRAGTCLGLLAVSALVACHASSPPAAAPASNVQALRSPSPTPSNAASTKPSRHRRHHRVHRRPPSGHNHPGVPAVDLPNPGLTPGVRLAVSAATVCRPGYATSVRDVSDAEKAAVYARYHVVWISGAHEVDHLISLELGGSNAIENLWPEPYAGRWGARTKDALEDRLHDLVCGGMLSLRSAQTQEATDWVAAYRRYVGAPPGPSSGGGTSAGGYYASSYPTAHTIYCADDPDWRNLSKTYLVHFRTLARAHARFPGYHLHRPC